MRLISWTLQSGSERKRFSSNVGYNGRGFFPLWDTIEEIFPMWDTMEKNYQCRMIFLNFKCLSLPSNRNLGKISFLNSQTIPRKKLKMENYMVNHENTFFSVFSLQQRIFLFLSFNNFGKLNFSAK
jgi:hypothetical protein